MSNQIKVTFPGGKRVDAEHKGYLVKTDQPLYAGGEGSAPAPFDLFLVSIAACAGFYALSFCQNRGISLEKSAVVMTAVKGEQTKRIERVIIDLNLPPEFPEKYREAVIKAVNQCPVREHLMHPPAFEVITHSSGVQTR